MLPAVFSPSPLVLALVALVVLGGSLAYVLRPLTPTPPLPRHSLGLALTRGLLNGSVVLFGLLEVGYPARASIAEGLTAGALSGFFQLTVMNERFSAYLNRATSEPGRVLRWAWFQAIFYGLVKAAGTLAGGGPPDAGTLVLAYALTITFGAAQYPWEAAIAARRVWKAALGEARERIRLVADLQTVTVSVTCVGVSILNSVGVPGSRLFLAVVGVVGLGYYALILRAGAVQRGVPARLAAQPLA